MNNFRKTFITILLFFSLIMVFSMEANFATDEHIDNTTVGGINGALAKIDDNDTIFLAPGTYNKVNDHFNFTINKNVTICGDGPLNSVILDGENKSKIFTIGSNLNVTFINIVFTNGNQVYVDDGTTNQGGAIYALDTTVNVVNCTFTNNTATNFGGAICAIRTSLDVVGSNFINNSVTGYYIGVNYCGGGAIYTGDGVLSLSGSNFTDNTVAYRGGAIYSYISAVDISDSNFNNNSATISNGSSSFGGVIYNLNGTHFNIVDSNFTGNYVNMGSAAVIYNTGDNFNIFNSIFTDNYVTNGSAGAILNTAHNFSVANSTFTDNHASNNAGALYNTGGSNFTVANSTFTNNTAANGAAFYNVNGNISSVANSNFTNNTAANFGGAISAINSTMEVADSDFINNSVTEFDDGSGIGIIGYGGGAIYIVNGTLSVLTSNFTDNTAANRGGAIYANNSLVDVNDCNFIGNDAFNAGAIYNTGVDFRVVSSNFTANSANSTGGAIYSSGNFTSIDNSVFTGNHVNPNFGSGGAVSNIGNFLSIANSTFSDNYAYYVGGAVHNTGVNFSVVGSNFTGNYARYVTGSSSYGNGGAIYNSGNFFYIANSTFIGDNNANSGGAIYNSGNFTSVVNASFTDNYVTYYGAGIFNSGVNFSVVDSNFTGNRAGNAQGTGGGIYNSGVNFSVVDSIFTDNYAENGVYGGGAIYNSANFTSVANSTFISNNARNSGGAILNYGDFTSAANSTFISNNASYGGAISNRGVNFSLVDSTFSSNNASNGGAIHNLGNFTSVVNSTFIGNNARGDGGAAIHNSGNFTSVVNSTFLDNIVDVIFNYALRSGGAIFNTGLNFSVVNSNFTGNYANEDGGAIYNTGNFTSVINSTFISNNGGRNGGGIYSIGLNLNVTNSIFDENNARFYVGGGVYIGGNDSIIINSNFTNNNQGIGINTTIFTLENNRLIDNYIAIQFAFVNETYTISGLSSDNYISDNDFAIGISGTGSNYTVDDSFGSLNSGGFTFTMSASHNTIVDSNISGYNRSDSKAIFFEGSYYSNNSVIYSNITENTNGIFFNGSSTFNYDYVLSCNISNNVNGVVFGESSRDNSVLSCNISNNVNGVVFDGSSRASSVVSCNISNNTNGILINGRNNKVLGCDIFNNDLGIHVLPGANNSTINYNRILNNTDTNGFDLLNEGNNTNANYNWWGNNTALVSGINLTNRFVMALSANSYTTTVNNTTHQLVGDVELSYELVLITNAGVISIIDYNLLPDFLVNLIWNGTSGTIYNLNVNGKGKHSQNFTLSYDNYFSLQAIGDNEDIILYLDPDLSNVVNLTINKTTNVSGNANYGDEITYIITVTNHGPANATGVMLIDELDSRLIYGGVTGDRTWTFDVATNTLTWDIGNLVVNGNVTINISVKINGTGHIVNFANITVNQDNLANNSTDGADSTVDVPTTVNLTISKTSDLSIVRVGNIVTYNITVTNNGPDNLTDIVVEDVLDSRLSFSGAYGDRNRHYENHTVYWDIGTLNAYETVTLFIMVEVEDTGTITNFANITLDSDIVNIGENSDNCTIEVIRIVNLTITKENNVTGSVNVGDLVNYTITVKNNGLDNATNVVVTDILDHRLIFVDVSSGAIWNDTAIIWTIGNLNYGETVTLNITVRINSSGDIFNMVNVTLNEDNIGDNGTDGTGSNLTIPETVNLTINKTHNVTSSVTVGDEVLYTIVVTNYGPDVATGVVVSDVLDSRLIYVNSSVGSSYNATTRIVSWNISSIAVGSTETLTLTVRVNGSGDIFNLANVSANEVNIGENGTDGAGSNLTLPDTVNLTITKYHNVTGSVTVGDEVLYTIVVTNYGPDVATGIVVSDILDSRLIYVSSSAGSSYNATTRTVSWDISSIAVGSNETLTVTVQVNGSGNIVNLANVTANEVNIGNNSTLGDGNNSTLDLDSAVNLTITKNHNVTGSVTVGDEVLYTIVVTNHGPDVATGIVVSDVLDSRLIYVNSSVGSSYNATTRIVSWNISSIAVGSSETLTLTVRVNGSGDIFNEANLTVNEINIGENGTDGADSNLTLPDTVNLTLNKSHNVTGTVNVGDEILYTIVVTNHGPDVATGVVVSDVLDSRLIYVSSSPGSTYNATTRTVSWEISSIAAGSNETLTLTVQVNGSGNIVNLANVTSNEVNIGNNTTTGDGNNSTIDLDKTVNLTINKSHNITTSVTVGDEVLYTIVVTNHGPDIATDVVVSDALDSRLIYVNSSVGSSYNATSRTVSWDILSIAVGSSETLTLTVIVNGSGDIFNEANLTVNEINIGENGTDGADSNLTLPDTVNLTLNKSHNVTGSVTVGDEILYTIVVTNHGPDIATGVVVSDVLDSRLIYVGSSAGSSYNATTRTVLWDISSIAAGFNETLTLTVQVNGSGNIVNLASVTANEVNIGNNSTTGDGNNSTLDLDKTVNLTITKNHNVTGSVTVGDEVLYTIVVTNHGPDIATDVVVSDVLDSRLIYVNSSVGSSFNATTRTVSWDISSIAVGSSETLTLTVIVNGSGDIFNVANLTVNEINIGENGTDGADSNLTLPDTVNLTLNKSHNVTGSVTVGDEILYTIVVTNHGPDIATGVVVSDVLDSRLIYVSSSAGSSYNATTRTVSWDISSIAAGFNETLTLTVQVNGSGNIVNLANVTANEVNIGNNSTTGDGNNSTIDLEKTVNLTITKNHNVTGSVTVGDEVLYTIVVTNHGPDVATGLVVSDVLDSRLIYVNSSVGSSFNATTRTVSWNISSIAVGSSETLTLTVKVNGSGDIFNEANLTVNEINIGENGTDGADSNLTIPDTVNLTLNKSHNVTGTVTVGDEILYTIVVTNHGPDIATGVVVSDVLDSRLIYVSSSAGSTFNATTRTVSWDISSIAAGFNETLTLTVQVNGSGNIVNLANVTSNEVNIGNNSTTGDGNNSTIDLEKTVNLTINKSHNVTGSVTVGDEVLYTIVVTNHGPDIATGIVVSDVLDSRLIYANSSVGSSYNATSRTVSWNISSIAVGGSETLTLTVIVNGSGDIFNEANLTVNEINIGENGTDGADSNLTLPDTVNLTITKYHNATSSLIVGDEILYTIVVTNYGPDIATGVVVSDVIDSRLIYVSSSPGSTYNATTRTVSWDISSIAAGFNETLTVTVQVNGSGNIVNLANVTANEVNIGNNSTTDDGNNSTIDLEKTVNLTITKHHNATASTIFGDTVLYTIVVTNHGPDIATGVVISDVLDYRLIYINNSAGASFNLATRTVTWNISSIATGNSVTLNITVRVNGSGNITNFANVTVNEVNIGENGTNGTGSNLTIPNTVNLTLTKINNVTGSIALGDTVVYTIVLTNHGPNIATGLVVSDELDSRLVFVTASSVYNWTFDIATNTVNWNVGNLNVNGTVTLTITIYINGTGDIDNFANISHVNETNIGNNSSEGNNNTITIPPTVNLTINKSINSTTVEKGDLVTYTINVTNHGPDIATGVVVTDVLDHRLIFVSASSPNVWNGNAVVWNIGSINVGNTVTLNIIVRFNGTGNITNIANISDVNEINIGNNSTYGNNSTIVVPGSSNLTIRKESNINGSLNYGDLIIYTITVTNHGPDDANGLVVSDTLDYRLIFVSSTGDYNESTGLWIVGNLNVGQSASLNITVRINGTGNITNTAKIEGLEQNNTGNNSTEGNNNGSIEIPNTVNLTVTKTTNVTGPVDLGDLITYTITVTNNGPDNGTGIVVYDILDSRLIFVNSSAAYDVSTGLWTIGNLNVGQSAFLKIVVRVNGTGNIVNIANVTSNEPNVGHNNSDGGNNSTIMVLYIVNLTITKTLNVRGIVNIGDLLIYTITVTNHGPDNATEVFVSDILDSRLTFVSSTGSYDETTGLWFIGNLDVNQTVSLNITVFVNGAGGMVNVANVSSNETNIGNSTTEGDNNNRIVVRGDVNLFVIKTSNITSIIHLGDLVAYTISVVNYGPDNATVVRVSDVLDVRLVYVSSNATKGSYDPATALWYIGNLDVGQTVTLTIVVMVNGSGAIVNNASVFAAQNIIGGIIVDEVKIKVDNSGLPDDPDVNPDIDPDVDPDDIEEDDPDENNVLGDINQSKVAMARTGVPILAIFIVTFLLLLGGVYQRKLVK